MKYSSSCGENVTGGSWVMKIFGKPLKELVHHLVAIKSTKAQSSGINSIIERAIHAQGLWKPKGMVRNGEIGTVLMDFANFSRPKQNKL